MKKTKKLWHGLIFIVILAAAIAILMLLWNALIPSIIGWSAINYWQAAGLFILCKLLFGGFGRFGRGFHHWGHHHGHGHKEAMHLHEKMRGMTREEKREFIRNRMTKGFGDMSDKENESSSPRQEE